MFANCTRGTEGGPEESRPRRHRLQFPGRRRRLHLRGSRLQRDRRAYGRLQQCQPGHRPDRQVRDGGALRSADHGAAQPATVQHRVGALAVQLRAVRARPAGGGSVATGREQESGHQTVRDHQTVAALDREQFL